MRIDGGMRGGLERAAAEAAGLERRGYDGILTAETSHDPFFPLLLAAQGSERLELSTSIAVAFARSPMTLAQTSWDLQAASGGRFILGLGSQIKPHITRRFSMPWSHPAARMREMVQAIRAIWACWNEGTTLDFRGEFYTHTLMTPFFNPGPNPHGDPRIYLAGVGELMTEVAGEVADGFICHGFTTRRYLDEVTLPSLEKGRAKAGKTMEGFELSGPMFVVTGRDEDEMAKAAEGVRRQIAFYGSTPAYRKVLDLHGWGDLQDELNRMSKEGRWAEMGELVDDDILREFAVVAPLDEVAAGLRARWGDVLTRLSFYTPYESDDAHWDQVIADLKAI
jgi:probable F420-dependent oxidoreductase